MTKINKEAKKRIIKLLAHYIEKNVNGINSLTEEEENVLLNSFNTEEEIYTFEYYNKINEQIRYAFSYFVQVKLICIQEITELKSHIQKFNYYKQMEKIINSLLLKFEDIEQKKMIIQHFVEEQNFESTDICNQENKTIYFDTETIVFYPNFPDALFREQTSLQQDIESGVDSVNKTIIRHATISYAIREHIKLTGLNVKSYEELFQIEESNLYDYFIELDNNRKDHPYLSKLMNLREGLKIDQIFYEEFKTNFLNTDE